MEHDLHCLVTVISIARRTGQWQVDGVNLRTVDYNRVFGQDVPTKLVLLIENLMSTAYEVYAATVL